MLFRLPAPRGGGAAADELVRRRALRPRLRRLGRGRLARLARGRLATRGARLRLRLRAPMLTDVPWELLYDRRRPGFVARSDRSTLVRLVDSATVDRRAPVRGTAPVVVVFAGEVRSLRGRAAVGRPPERRRVLGEDRSRRPRAPLRVLRHERWSGRCVIVRSTSCTSSMTERPRDGCSDGPRPRTAGRRPPRAAAGGPRPAREGCGGSSRRASGRRLSGWSDTVAQRCSRCGDR